MPDLDRATLETLLASRGVGRSVDLALDATITPETLAAIAAPSAAPPAAASQSVGPLPRIALSGSVPSATSRSTAPAHGSADLELLGVIGEGGMGRVHLARQRSLGREVAIKTLKDEVADARAAEMLRVEATIMGRLEHPNVVPVHAVGLDDGGRLVLVMKRIDGAPWRDLLRDPSHPRWAELAPREEDRLDAHLGVLAQVANALELAHARGVIHRDVKPENVLLGAHGEVYLADWGVALRTDDAAGTELVGTPAYMAPEMVVGDRSKIDARTDVFLLGATLHEILVGQPPHHGETLQATLLAAFDAEPPTYGPDVPAEVAVIARRAMARDPAGRFPSALAFRRALDDLRTHRTSIALTRTAQSLLAALEADASLAQRDRRLTECRFALHSALREWPENPAAKDALARCVRLAIAFEIARDGAEAARALLDELEGGDADLEAQLVALEGRLAERRAAVEKLRAIENDSNLWVGMRARAATFGVIVLAGISVSVYVITLGGGSTRSFTPWDVVRIGAVMSVVFTLVLPLARHQLANAVGRRILALLALSVYGMLVHRIIAAVWDVPPAATLTVDFVILGTLAGAAGTVVPRAGWAALPAAIGIVLAMVLPGSVAVVFSLGTLAMMAVIISLTVLQLWETRSRRGGGPPSSS